MHLQVLNTQYTFDGLYLSCVAENIDQLRPFGDVPRKMATSVKRSLVAARALVKALRSGHEIMEQMLKVITMFCLTLNLWLSASREIVNDPPRNRYRKVGYKANIASF